MASWRVTGAQLVSRFPRPARYQASPAFYWRACAVAHELSSLLLAESVATPRQRSQFTFEWRNTMSKKERTKLRRNNHRAKKQAQNLRPQQSAASALPNAPSACAAIASQAEQEASATRSAFAGGLCDPVAVEKALKGLREMPADPPALIARLENDDTSIAECRAILERLVEYSATLEPDADHTPEQVEGLLEQIQQVVSLHSPFVGDFVSEPRPEGAAPPSVSTAAEETPKPGHSTGPRSIAGKVRASQNARKHGLSCLTSSFMLLDDENEQEWIALRGDLQEEFQPASRTEHILVNDMAQSHWLTQRAINLQTNSIDDPKAFALFLRYQTTHHRAYYRALKQLLALQKARKQSASQPEVEREAAAPPGSSTTAAAPKPAPTPDPEPVVVPPPAPSHGAVNESTRPQAA